MLDSKFRDIMAGFASRVKYLDTQALWGRSHFCSPPSPFWQQVVRHAAKPVPIPLSGAEGHDIEGLAIRAFQDVART